MIYPSIMARNQKELDLLLKKFSKPNSKFNPRKFHLDLADGKFVNNNSLNFNFKLPSQFKYQAHLMIEDPDHWIQDLNPNSLKLIDTLIFHPETSKNITRTITRIKLSGKKVGLALNPEVKVAAVSKYLSQVDVVLILTVKPGFYGSKFKIAPLKKIKLIQKLNPKLKVIVDGGMTPETVGYAVEAGADDIVSGSFLSKSRDPRQAIKELVSAIKSRVLS